MRSEKLAHDIFSEEGKILRIKNSRYSTIYDE